MVPAVTATGVANSAVCQPDALSPENVTWPSRWLPFAVHTLPTCVPVFAAAL